ncbi:AMP-binding protein [Nonomuraea sp. NPDC049695]|uniref:AMP-binding protein n=1 Tax=Nonomuraea sp. NPDC049695 TaxID=3154734 RepID=UPI00341D06C4
MIFTSAYPHIGLIEAPVHQVVLRRAAEFGDRPALVDGLTGEVTTYRQLDERSRRLAAAFASAGVRKGDVLAVHSPNSVLYPVVLYGAMRAGAVITPVPAVATVPEMAGQLADSRCRWIVTTPAGLGVAHEAAERAGGVEEIFVCGPGEDGCPSILEMQHSAAPEPYIVFDAREDLAVLPYSSGTTGAPKGVMLSHSNVATNLVQIETFLPSRVGEPLLAVLPFSHIYGLTVLLNTPLRMGATVVVLPRFDLEEFLTAIETYRIAGLYVAPPIVLMLAKHPAVEGRDLSSLEFVLSAAAPLDAGLAEACARRLGLPSVVQGYGMTELSPGVSLCPRGGKDAPAGTVGRLLPGTELRLLDLAAPGRDAAPGAPGEIAVRGPQVMKGYLGRPGDTAAMIDEGGWLHTGDVGRMDGDGWLHIVDRVKELIKYKGYQVPPAELEALLLAHEAIADAAVVGVYDAEGNEVPRAYVVRRPGSELDEDDVMAYVAGLVAPYKKVRQVRFVEAVPRSASGKILRRELRDADG